MKKFIYIVTVEADAQAQANQVMSTLSDLGINGVLESVVLFDMDSLNRIIGNNNRVVTDATQQARIDGIIHGLETARELLVGESRSDTGNED